MILGVSHIVLGSTNLSHDRAWYEALGWSTVFEQRDMPTPEGKRGFMSTASSAQGLVLMQPPSGLPVELIHYADVLPDPSASPLQVVLPRPATLHEGRVLGDVPGYEDVVACEVPRGTSPLWLSDRAPVPSIVVHHVTSRETATRFWCEGVGFTPRPTAATPSTTSGSVLEFRSAIPQWRATLHLVPREGPAVPGSLDGPGFRCLSMVAKNPAKAVDQLLRAGATGTTGRLDLVVNGKPLCLEILQGPDGVFVEILSIAS